MQLRLARSFKFFVLRSYKYFFLGTLTLSKLPQKCRAIPAALHPVYVQVFSQECGAHHAYALLHPPCLPQLAHACVDHGEAGLPLLPSLQSFGIIRPILQSEQQDLVKGVM